MKTDKITLEILKSQFTAVAEGMAYALERTAHTTFVKESADYATALATVRGEFFGYPRGMGVASFVGLSLKPFIDAVGEMAPGDIAITNDPYGSVGLATHLPDIHLIKPVFADGRLLAFAWCFIHSSDVGGLVSASVSPHAYEIQQEGIRIPPQKLVRAGEVDRELRDLFLANCRIPKQNWGDMKAMIAALNTGESRLREMAAKYGGEAIANAADDMLAWSEEGIRAVVAEIPDGTYAFIDYMDDDAEGSPIRLALSLRIDGSDAFLDFSGTDPQVNAALNVPAFGRKHPFPAIGLTNYALSQNPFIPLTAGIMRPITVHAPVGSVLNPRYPAAVGVRYATVIRTYQLVLGALAQAVPGRVPAASGGQACMIALSVPDLHTGERHVTVIEPLKGSSGGSDRHDGGNGNDGDAADIKNTPIESVESHIPVLVEQYELIPDSAGAGLHRGGWATRVRFRVLRPGSILTARAMERTKFESWGVGGGKAAGRTEAWLNPGTSSARALGRIGVLHLDPGDVVSVQAPGGAGWGDPLKRDPAAVIADVRTDLLSVARAAQDYGVVITGGAVDERATDSLRRRLSAARGPVRIGDFDLGPSRREYEALWSKEAADALAELLYALPHSLRPWAKRTIREAAAPRGSRPLTREDIEATWRAVAIELNLDLDSAGAAG
jgi:N-methylhydantoinase B